MIKELSNFITSLDPEMKSLGIKHKEGLHILLKIEKVDGQLSITDTAQSVFTRKKETSPEDITLLKKFATLSQLSWCVNTNKCFDLPIKAIHSCSPYCIAIKRENLTGGEKYKSNTKTQVYDRISDYFSKAIALLETEEEKQYVKVFENAINDEPRFNNRLESIPEYSMVKDAEYVIFYLDVPINQYEKVNTQYLKDKLFNTNEYNKEIAGTIYGTSDFFNGYPTKKPFLSHQSASFDIAARVSARQARDLYEFKEMMARNILPKPLPIFIHQDELKLKDGKNLQESSIQIFKKDALKGERRTYQEIITELYEQHQDELGNYYLLYYDREEIKDFDFVPKFEYLLKDKNDAPWEIKDLFNAPNAQRIKNVFHFQQAVLHPVFNNTLITKTKAGDFQYRFFDDIDSKYCKSELTYIQTMQFRRAFYDFVYKSKRQAVTSHMFNEILQASILEDIRLDEIKNSYHTQDRSIREKLNIWFSLTENFDSTHKNNTTMANKLPIHQEFVQKLTKGEAHITSDDEYAFTVGQIIYYLLLKSETADRSHKRLEAFTQQVHARELNKALVRLFDTYKHAYFSSNFQLPFSEALAYETKTNIRDLLPTMISGYFSKNWLTSTKEQPINESILTDQETEA